MYQAMIKTLFLKYCVNRRVPIKKDIQSKHNYAEPKLVLYAVFFLGYIMNINQFNKVKSLK